MIVSTPVDRPIVDLGAPLPPFPDDLSAGGNTPATKGRGLCRVFLLEEKGVR